MPTLRGQSLRPHYGGPFRRTMARLKLKNAPTMRKLALMAGYSEEHLSHVFAGHRRPSIECLNALAEALKITPRALLAAMERSLPSPGPRS